MVLSSLDTSLRQKVSRQGNWHLKIGKLGFLEKSGSGSPRDAESHLKRPGTSATQLRELLNSNKSYIYFVLLLN